MPFLFVDGRKRRWDVWMKNGEMQNFIWNVVLPLHRKCWCGMQYATFDFIPDNLNAISYITNTHSSWKRLTLTSFHGLFGLPICSQSNVPGICWEDNWVIYTTVQKISTTFGFLRTRHGFIEQDLLIFRMWEFAVPKNFKSILKLVYIQIW